MLRYLPLLLVPLSLGMETLGAGPVWIFLTGAAAVAVLADWVRRGTEGLAAHAGPAIGGLLNVSFGSVAELILALFVLTSGQVAVVQAQMTGSILATTLLGLGLAMLVGGLGRDRQCFNRANAGLLSTLLTLLMIALLLPAVFDLTERTTVSPRAAQITDEEVSLGISAVLLVLYAANLVYTLVTHRNVFSRDEEGGEGGTPWSVARSLAVMVAGTAMIAWEAELVSGALEATARTLGLSTVFLGVILLAVVGTAADLFAAVVFARQDRMSLAFSICIGSAIQVALVLAPLLVIISWFLGTPMTLVFTSPLDLFAIAGAAFVVRAVAADGESTWFEGLVLVGVYLMLAIGFFFVGPA
ncbi:calcium/proton exchanger [Muricoccus aerilatus]|uniref:calcium/proton exchanger n=1 Tax=Muricoccus aerilatus TaxID=452982 RepID=UPI0005C236F4|nr:calcium/proton exchanger [Roseomonas aerilata]